MRLLLALFAVASVAQAQAQTPAPRVVLDPMLDLSAVPPRPPLAALATLDSNDAHQYYDVGMASVDTNQPLAAAAFFWASRLDPSWAEPYFARWYVLRRAEPRATSDSVRNLVDSLRDVALMRDPFVDEQISLQGRSDRRISNWYFAYSGRRYDLASQELAKLIPKYPNVLDVYVYRAKATYYLDQYDTAAAVQLFLGETLLAAHRPAEAIEHLRAATVADPYFALPYLLLGQASALAHDTSASLVAYRAFLAHASRADNLRRSAEEALAVLGRPVK
jgi:tetratricopeptide (TPR) repeat protein